MFHFGHSALVNDEGKSVMIQPWYRQFYLRRGDAEWYSDRISDHGYTSGLEAVDGFAYVGTTMYGSPTEVVIEVREDDPGIPESADCSAEAVLSGDGDLAILNWDPDDQPVATIHMPEGNVRLRASWFGTKAAAAHPDSDVGGEERSPERIVLDLWPAP